VILAEYEDGSKTKVVPNFKTYNFPYYLSSQFGMEFEL